MKELIDIQDVHIEHIKVSNKNQIGKKCFGYFIVYVNHSFDDLKPLYIQLPKPNGTIYSFKAVKYLTFMLKEKNEYVKTNCLSYSMILIDSVFKSFKRYYHQVFLEECKCKINEKKEKYL